MKSLDSLIFVFLLSIFLALSQCSIAAQKGLITKTCKETPYYNLCVSTLDSGPGNLKATLKGLSLIAINAVKAKATSIGKDMKKLIASNPKLKAPLSECNGFYNRVVNDHIPKAVKALMKGDPKAAADGMTKAAAEADECRKKMISASQNFAKDGMSKAWEALRDLCKTVYYLSLL